MVDHIMMYSENCFRTFYETIKLGVLNSRMKDFYDIWFLSRVFDFKGETLGEAIEKTFENRNTPMTASPTVFDSSFLNDTDKKVPWLGFIKKSKLTDAPEYIEDVAAAVKVFLEPLVSSLCERQTFHGIWAAPGPWRRRERGYSLFIIRSLLVKPNL